MLDRQRLARHGPASALLLAAVFLGAEPGRLRPGRPARARPPSRPTPRRPTRAGRSARPWPIVLFPALGWSSYLVLLGLAGRRPAALPPPAGPRARRCRLLGFGAGASRSAAAWSSGSRPASSRSPPVGSGGYLGALAVDVPRRAVRAGRDAPDPARRRGWSGLALCYDVLFVWPVAGGRRAGPRGVRQAARGRCARPACRADAADARRSRLLRSSGRTTAPPAPDRRRGARPRRPTASPAVDAGRAAG